MKLLTKRRSLSFHVSEIVKLNKVCNVAIWLICGSISLFHRLCFTIYRGNYILSKAEQKGRRENEEEEKEN